MQKIIKKITVFILTLAMVVTLLPSSMTNVSAETNDENFYRIFHLDAGRKYFSVAQIKGIIDTLSENNYTHLELALGNDGLRFLLDNMEVTANDTTYASDKVKAGIQAGNIAYSGEGTNELTQTEMDGIIKYAKGKNISIIPLINTPGHMDAILDCMKSIGISNPAYNNSDRTVDVTNPEAVNFTLALVDKYITYFADKGCTIFNMGCDEYANDISGSGFAGLISSGSYNKFVEYVNKMAAQIKSAGMTPMAFNDGIYYNKNTNDGTFDNNIMIAYWTSGWGGYSPASASFLAEKGHKIINTNDAWYYVLGRTSGTYALASAQGGVKNTVCTDIPGDSDPSASGSMVCLWCDTPSASYSDAEVSNVSGLISDFAKNNSTYFNVNDDSNSDNIINKTINVTKGQTVTDTIKGVDYSSNIDNTELDQTIATVSAKYETIPSETTIEKATSLETGQSYLIGDGKGHYLSLNNGNIVNSTNPDTATKWTVSKYNSKYYCFKNGNVTLAWYGNSEYGLFTSGDANMWNYDETNGIHYSYSTENMYMYYNNGWQASNSLNGDSVAAYKLTQTEATNGTTVSFKGVNVGTTYVTVENVRYTINVIDEDLSDATPLNAEYWITNLPVTAGGTTSTSISAMNAYGEKGVDISTLIPATGNYAYGNVVYWKGTVLDADNKQTSAPGVENDKTGAGKDFNLIRYYEKNWQYFDKGSNQWVTINGNDQVVIYWLQPTEVTKEITTLVKDWGYDLDEQGNDSNNKVALTVAVVYPDGTVSPTEGDMYSQSTTLFNYWSSPTNRDIGLVAPINNSDYDISKITVTDGTRDQSGTGQWGANDTITWEKTTNEAGEQWYNETTYWTEADGGTPMVNGLTSGITWSNYNTAKLVLIYLKPVHYDTNLTVNWVDDNASGSLISTMEVAVSSDGTPTTFYNGLKQISALPTEGVGGTFTLDDSAYVTNNSDVKQGFNKSISTVPGVAAQYKSGLYKYVSADLSADGKTLTLHYNLDNSKLENKYVLDFGLPVKVPLSDLVDNVNEVTSVSCESKKVTINNDNKGIVYTPDKVMTGTDIITITLYYGNNNSQNIRIAFVPATTVYYEESFGTYTNGKSTGNSSNQYQTASKPGQISDVHYGYDTSYSDGNEDSNGTSVELNKGGEGCFVFTGTGVDIYTRSTPDTGSLMAAVFNNKTDEMVGMYSVDTAMKAGSTDSTSMQTVNGYNVPVISISDLPNAEYRVEIIETMSKETVTNTDGTTSVVKTNKSVYIDGYRVYNDSVDADSYDKDNEKDPKYVELRNSLLSAIGVDTSNSQYANQIARGIAQVYSTDEANEGVVVIDTNNSSLGKIGKIDLLDNGPKNEIYLNPGQALVFKLGNASQYKNVQVGLKALDKAVTYSINNVGEQTLLSSTDMFYKIDDFGTVTITNKSGGILSITKLKAIPTDSDNQSVSFAALSAEDFMPALLSLGYEAEPAKADAKLTVKVNDKSTVLSVNGVVGETNTFTESEIQEAAESLVDDGYTLNAKYSDVSVAFGEESTVEFTTKKENLLNKIFNKVVDVFKWIFGK